MGVVTSPPSLLGIFKNNTLLRIMTCPCQNINTWGINFCLNQSVAEAETGLDNFNFVKCRFTARMLWCYVAWEKWVQYLLWWLGGERIVIICSHSLLPLEWTDSSNISGFTVQLTPHVFFPQLQAEVQRLEELKLLNICNVIDAIRSEIAVFWEKCFFSTEQRQAFAPYFSGGFLFVWQFSLNQND